MKALSVHCTVVCFCLTSPLLLMVMCAQTVPCCDELILSARGVVEEKQGAALGVYTRMPDTKHSNKPIYVKDENNAKFYLHYRETGEHRGWIVGNKFQGRGRAFYISTKKLMRNNDEGGCPVGLKGAFNIDDKFDETFSIKCYKVRSGESNEIRPCCRTLKLESNGIIHRQQNILIQEPYTVVGKFNDRPLYIRKSTAQSSFAQREEYYLYFSTKGLRSDGWTIGNRAGSNQVFVTTGDANPTNLALFSSCPTDVVVGFVGIPSLPKIDESLRMKCLDFVQWSSGSDNSSFSRNTLKNKTNDQQHLSFSPVGIHTPASSMATNRQKVDDSGKETEWIVNNKNRVQLHPDINQCTCKNLVLQAYNHSGAIYRNQGGILGRYKLLGYGQSGKHLFMKRAVDSDHYLFYNKVNGWTIGPNDNGKEIYVTTNQHKVCPEQLESKAYDRGQTLDTSFTVRCTSRKFKNETPKCCSTVSMTSPGDGYISKSQSGRLGIYRRTEKMYNDKFIYHMENGTSFLYYRESGHQSDGWTIGNEVGSNKIGITTRDLRECPSGISGAYHLDKHFDSEFEIQCGITAVVDND